MTIYKDKIAIISLPWLLAGIAFVCFILIVLYRASGTGIAFAAETPPEAKPALKIAGKFTGANETEGIKLTSVVGTFSRALQIEATGEEVQDLSISVAPFTDPNANQIETKWTVNDQPGETKIPVPALGTANLKITASLPLEGTYTSVISLIYANRRWSIPLTVTRTRPVPTVEIPSLESVRESTLYDTEDVLIRVTLQETGGQEVKLFKPQLISLLVVQADKNKAQAKYEKLIVMDDKGQQLSDLFVLNPREAKPLQLIVKGLQDTGEFSGSLSLSGPDVGVVTRSVTLYRKKSWVLAAFLIFLGVLASYLMRLYAKTARPQLIRQRRVALVLSELEDIPRATSDLTDDEQEVLQELRRRLNDVYEDIQMLTDAQADAVINDADRKLDLFPKWVSARRGVHALQPPELQRPLLEKLLPVKPFMLRMPVLPDETKTIEDMLDKFPDEINTTSRIYLTEQLGVFRAEVKRHDETGSDEVRRRLAQEVGPKIEEADTCLRTEELKKAQAAYNEARFAYARLLADNLMTSLLQQPPPPRGFDSATWNKLKTDVVAALEKVGQASNAEQATTAYETAYTLYLREIIRNLRAHIQKQKPLIDVNTQISPEEKKAITEKLQASRTQLDNALQKIDSRQLREAGQDYEAARQVFEEVARQLQGRGMQMGGPGAAEATATTGGSVPDPFDLPFWRAAFQRKKRERPSLAQLERRLFRYDLAFTVSVLIAAVFFGVKLLWADNATWGGLREAHSLAASPPTPEERPVVWQPRVRSVMNTLPPKTRSSFAPAYRPERSLRLRAGGLQRRATAPPSR